MSDKKIELNPTSLSLQEERRLRTAYENAEGSEREKFSLFSVAVRGSHEKERTRAERTKNWSIIGSVLGALIGVMGSTYVNRVRLQVRRGATLGDLIQCTDSYFFLFLFFFLPEATALALFQHPPLNSRSY